jgi:hypothetical protein
MMKEMVAENRGNEDPAAKVAEMVARDNLKAQAGAVMKKFLMKLKEKRDMSPPEKSQEEKDAMFAKLQTAWTAQGLPEKASNMEECRILAASIIGIGMDKVMQQISA